MTTQSSQVILINGYGVLFVVLNAFGLGMRLPIGKLLAQAFTHWKIALLTLAVNFLVIPSCSSAIYSPSRRPFPTR